jgi:hypothetical protein
MNFDKEYVKFVRHITDPKKSDIMGPVKLSKKEDMFAKLFVAYLNCRYASAYLTSAMHSDGEGQCIECGEVGKHLFGYKMSKLD